MLSRILLVKHFSFLQCCFLQLAICGCLSVMLSSRVWPRGSISPYIACAHLMILIEYPLLFVRPSCSWSYSPFIFTLIRTKHHIILNSASLSLSLSLSLSRSLSSLFSLFLSLSRSLHFSLSPFLSLSLSLSPFLSLSLSLFLSLFLSLSLLSLSLFLSLSLSLSLALSLPPSPGSRKAESLEDNPIKSTLTYLTEVSSLVRGWLRNHLCWSSAALFSG